jgi:hypothetical protein
MEFVPCLEVSRERNGFGAHIEIASYRGTILSWERCLDDGVCFDYFDPEQSRPERQ